MREFKYMADACITEVVLQYTARSKEKLTFYPTGMRDYTLAEGSANMVERLFSAADDSGVNVYVGLQYRESFSGNPLPANWDNDEAALNISIADELWGKYNQQPGFKRRFKGWYLPLEVENLSFRNDAPQDQLINFYNRLGHHLHKKYSGLPVIVAPFFNTHVGQNSTAWKGMWTKILKTSPIDVVALQDSVGPLADTPDHQTYHATTQQLPEWFKATREAVDEARRQTGRDIQFWADTETYFQDYTTRREVDPFTDCPAVASATPEIERPLAVGRVVEDMRAVSAYVDRFTSFSFNHYMSPQQLWGNYYKTYVQYLSSGTVDQAPPTTPGRLVAVAESYDSVRLDWAPSTDNAGMAGYIIYRDNKIIRTVYLPDPATCAGFHDKLLSEATAYEYQVVAFDAAGNRSPASNAAKVTTSRHGFGELVSLDKRYSASVPASAPYLDVNGMNLTDGIIGDESRYECWQGRQTDQPYTFTVNLTGEHEIVEINSDWLQRKKDFVFLPKKVRYQVSLDGVNFKDVGEVVRPVDNECIQAMKYSLFNLNLTARHVRMIVEPGPGWSMTSEFQIFGALRN